MEALIPPLDQSRSCRCSVHIYGELVDETKRRCYKQEMTAQMPVVPSQRRIDDCRKQNKSSRLKHHQRVPTEVANNSVQAHRSKKSKGRALYGPFVNEKISGTGGSEVRRWTRLYVDWMGEGTQDPYGYVSSIGRCRCLCPVTMAEACPQDQRGRTESESGRFPELMPRVLSVVSQNIVNLDGRTRNADFFVSALECTSGTEDKL